MPTFVIASLTIREAQRRRILRVAVIMGVAFLALFGLGMHYIFRELESSTWRPNNGVDFFEVPATLLAMTGLYITNFLVVIMSVLISVASISSEIESRLIDTFVTKPIDRHQIVLGKWVGFAAMSCAYSLLLGSGILIITYLRTGISLSNPAGGLLIMTLNAIIMMTVTIAGGTRLSTLSNGVLAFMLYGVAFIGGWVETIGSTFRNEAAVNLGIVSSLIMPIEAIWKKAALVFQPRMLSNPEFAGPLPLSRL